MVHGVVASAVVALGVVVVALVAVQLQVRSRAATERAFDAIATLTDPALAGLPADDLIVELLGRLRRVVGADLVVLLVLDGERFVVRAQVGQPALDPSTVAIRAGQGLIGRVAEAAEPVLAGHVAPDEVFVRSLRGVVRSFLGCPLLVQGEVLGVLAVASNREAAFTAEDVRLGRRVAERMLPTLERARLEATARSMRNALEEAEHRERALAEAPPLGIVEVDRDGALRSWNRTAADLLGWPRWLRGVDVRVELPGEVVAAVESGLRGRRSSGLALTVARPAETPVELVASVAPVTALDGSVEGALLLLDDVTERQQMEGELRRAQRLEAMARLAGGVAHDFNNLLTVIKGHSEVLLKTMGAADEAREDVEAIRLAGDRAAELTKQLLTIGRRPGTEPQVVDLHERVRELAPVLERLIPADIELRVVTGSDHGAVRVEPNDLDQAVMNLVNNARDAMPEGGRLVVETRAVELRSRGASLAGVSAGRYVLLTVADNGPGMSKEVAERCFDPFFTTKGRGKGTGLGLALVYGTATAAGGHATVESEVGRGTTVRMWLREVDPTSAQPLPPAPRVRRRRRPSDRVLRVLLVEDDASIRSLARAALEEAGCEVTEAVGAEEALAKAGAEREAFDVLVSDVVLGGMTGDELAVRLCKRWPELRIVLMSGYTERSLALEPDAFLEKPLALEELTAAVARVADYGSKR